MAQWNKKRHSSKPFQLPCKDLVARHFIGAKLSDHMITARSHFKNLPEGFFKATGNPAVSFQPRRPEQPARRFPNQMIPPCKTIRFLD
jgi:hypothetical protein